MNVLESILKNLDSLPASKQLEVAPYVSSLNPKGHLERLAAIKATAGCMTADEGELFERRVREEADRLDDVK